MVERRIADHIRSLANPRRDLLAAIELGYDSLDRHVQDRWAVFEKDVSNQLSATGTPLSEAERIRLDRLEADLVAGRRRLELVDNEIRWTPQ